MRDDSGWSLSFRLALHVVFLCVGLALAWTTLLERFGWAT